MYFQDQSGASSTGQVVVYASMDKLEIPQFWSIGRALLTAGSTLDINTGSQPQNPPANTVRLWADGNGDLHILSGSGSDNLVYDSSNIGAVTLGGDLAGTISVGTVNLRNLSPISGRDTGGTTHRLSGLWNDNNPYYFLPTNASSIIFYSDNSGQIATLTHAGTLTINGYMNVNGNILYFGAGSGNITWNGSMLIASHSFMTVGIGYYFAGSSGIAITWNTANTTIQLTHNLELPNGHLYVGSVATGAHLSVWNANQLRVYGQLMVDGNQLFFNNAAMQVTFATGYYINNPAGTSLINTNGNFQTTSNYYFGSTAVTIGWNGTYLALSHSLIFPATGNQVVWPNSSYISGTAGYVQGSRRDQKQNIVPVGDHRLSNQVLDPRLVVYSFEWKEDGKRGLGFMLDEMEQVLPAYVVKDEAGESVGYSIQELTAILWAALRDLTTRVGKLEAV
jgi:hypothetical protein